MKKVLILLFSVLVLTVSCKKDDKKESVSFENATQEQVLDAIRAEDYASVKKMLSSNSYSQKEYNQFARFIYYRTKSVHQIVDLVESGLPADTYCETKPLLQLAIEEGLSKDCDLLIKNGLDVSKIANETNVDPLYIAIRQRGPEAKAVFEIVFNQLCKDDCRYFIENKDKEFKSPFSNFSELCINNRREFLKIFLEKDEIRKCLVDDERTLKYFVEQDGMFFEENNVLLNDNPVIDENYEYFLKACNLYSAEAIKYLMKREVMCHKDSVYYDMYFYNSFRNGDIVSPLSEEVYVIEFLKLTDEFYDYYVTHHKKD